MNSTRRRIRARARPALVWALVFFLGGHLLLGMHFCQSHLELCDPEFNLRLSNLRQRLAEAPGRPLALALGSSRIAYGMRPASVMQATAGSDREPVFFNLAMLGTGPVGEDLVLRRVLHMGVKPTWLFVEVWAPFLPQRGISDEEDPIFRRDVYWSDLPTIARLYHRLPEAAGRLFARSVTPLVHYRDSLLKYYAPDFSPGPVIVGAEPVERLKTCLDGHGWIPFAAERADPAGHHVHVLRAQIAAKPLFDEFRISAVSDTALHELLDECRAHGIRVALLMTPEHSLIRGWYAPMQAALTAYLRGLSAEYQAPVIDARAWCPDDDIPDCCHLSPRGAHAFSERFGREVYRPLLEGRPLPRELLLAR